MNSQTKNTLHPHPSLVVRGLKKSYGAKKVLDGIDFEVYPKELFGFIGRNGVGKSTTLDCIIGAKDFEEGDVEIKGVSLKKDPVKAKSFFGYVASEPLCYEVMTGDEYLDFIASVYGVEEAELEKNKSYLAHRFSLSEEDLAREISSYSHGMKQKLCLIASLLHTPALWILDEPTVGLDVMAIETLKKMMRAYADSGHSVLITSHNIKLVSELCDRVGILKDGKITRLLDLRQEPNYRLMLPALFSQETETKEAS